MEQPDPLKQIIGHLSASALSTNEIYAKIRKILDKTRVNINSFSESKLTPLCLAARSGHVKIIEYFLRELNADPNLRDETKFNLSPIQWALLNFESDSTDSVRLLLAFGASLEDIRTNNERDDFVGKLEKFRLDLKAESDKGRKAKDVLADEDFRPIPVNDTLHYWLQYTRKMPKMDQKLLNRMKKSEYLIKLQVTGPIGQRLAKHAFSSSLITWDSDSEDRERPLVLAFCGPSGHGKTELAQAFAREINLPESSVLFVDCSSEFDTVFSAFGSANGYAANQSGSRLNNFLCDNSGKPAVIILDEFHQAGGGEVWNKFLAVFDRGEYLDRRDTTSSEKTKADLRNMVIILTTNSADPVIHQYCREHPHLIHDDHKFDLRSDELNRHIKPLNHKIQRSLMGTFGKPFVGRISGIVPFVYFNPTEAAVIADGLIRQMTLRFKSGPNAKREIGHIQLRPIGNLNDYFADKYYEARELGVRQMRNYIEEEIKHNLVHLWKKAEIDNGKSEKERADVYCFAIDSNDFGPSVVISKNRPEDLTSLFQSHASKDAALVKEEKKKEEEEEEEEIITTNPDNLL